MRGKDEVGKLRELVTVQSRSYASDGMGGQRRCFTDAGDVWANISPYAGEKKFFSRGIELRLSHRLTIRYFEGLTINHRIKHGSRVFQIHAIKDIEERHRFQELECEEGPAS